MTHWTEAAIAAALEGRFFLIDGSDKHKIDAQLEAQRQADKIRERQELAAMTRIEAIVQDEPKPELPPDAILTAVAHAHKCGVDQIRSATRITRIVHARQHACALIRELTSMSYPQIGRAIGGRDHATVVHSVQRWTLRGHVYDAQDRKVRQMLGVNK